MAESNEIKISISSPPDREFLVAEIFVGNEQIAEISRENEALEVEIYPRNSGKFWKIDYENLIRVLNEAKQKLEKRSD